VTDEQEATQTAEPPPPISDGFEDRGARRDLERALRPRRENAEPVDQPLALICQAQRSGGTLLVRLFDAHPQCHAHPHELLIGYPKPHTWPELPLDEGPEVWFAKLKEGYLSTLYIKGRRKIPLKAPGEKTKGMGSYPFLLPPTFQRAIFLEEVERRRPITSEREILDAYMTSLFNGWLDNQNLRGRKKEWVVAFSPRRAWGEGLDKFFELYPEGRLISILRDPLGWFASAQGRDPDSDPTAPLDVWLRSAGEMLEASERHEDRVRIVRFDQLVLNTGQAMRGLADFLGIDFDPILTEPTFNGYPVGPNSSFAEDRTGVVADPVERYKEVLSPEQQELIAERCDELYREVLAVADRQAA
jgi:sulfotransferase family protein